MPPAGFNMDAGSSTLPGARQNRNLQQPRQSSAAVAELRAILLPRYGEGHILGPGQLVPIWDIDKWARTDVPFELQGCFATLHNGALVCQGEPQMLTNLEAIRCLVERGSLGSDFEQTRNRELAIRSVSAVLAASAPSARTCIQSACCLSPARTGSTALA